VDPLVGEGPPRSGGGPEPFGARIESLSKSFGATRALRDFGFTFGGGSTYVLAGENGSGKSTFVKILAGVLAPDHGSIFIGGQPVRRFTPRAAIDAGIATCFQEVLVEDNLSVLDNIFLADRGWVRQRTPTPRRVEMAEAVLSSLSVNPPRVGQRVDELGLAERQLVVIARALCQQGARVFLLDESTAALDQSDSERALGVFADRAAAGAVVIFTSHRLDEVERIGDQIVVLRNGQMSGILERAELSEPRLLALMSEGADTTTARRQAAFAGGARVSTAMAAASGQLVGQPSSARPRLVLALRAVSVNASAPTVDLEIVSGEVTGLAGLDGHGQASLLRYLGGVERPSMGRVEALRGGSVAVLSRHRQAVAAGIVYIPRERKTQGIFPTLSVLDNFGLPTAGDRSRWGFLGTGRTNAAFRPLAERLAVRAPSWRAPITSLSGGNQQKVLIARWLAAQPEAVLLDDPTRGVDITTKADLYTLLRELALAERAVVMVSTELEELVGLCDRIVVMHRFAVAADLRREGGAPIRREEVLAAMFGRGR
jgi:ribose transport system ATP-binding protein